MAIKLSSLYRKKFLFIVNSVGVFFYSMRILEKLCGDAFDVVGSSHQVMHIMLVAGALLYRTGLLFARQAVKKIVPLDYHVPRADNLAL